VITDEGLATQETDGLPVSVASERIDADAFMLLYPAFMLLYAFVAQAVSAPHG
jgi:hypothetical protein